MTMIRKSNRMRRKKNLTFRWIFRIWTTKHMVKRLISMDRRRTTRQNSTERLVATNSARELLQFKQKIFKLILNENLTQLCLKREKRLCLRFSNNNLLNLFCKSRKLYSREVLPLEEVWNSHLLLNRRVNSKSHQTTSTEEQWREQQ